MSQARRLFDDLRRTLVRSKRDLDQGECELNELLDILPPRPTQILLKRLRELEKSLSSLKSNLGACKGPRQEEIWYAYSNDSIHEVKVWVQGNYLWGKPDQFIGDLEVGTDFREIQATNSCPHVSMYNFKLYRNKKDLVFALTGRAKELRYETERAEARLTEVAQSKDYFARKLTDCLNLLNQLTQETERKENP